MTFSYDDSKHLYTADGIPLPHLTGMMEADGLSDYSGVPPWILERKRRIGIMVHETTKAMDKGEDAEVNEAITPYVDAWADCVRLSGWTWEGIEEPFVANYQGFLFGLTPDRWGFDRNGNHIVVELKATYDKHDWHHIQTACQALAVEYPEICERRVVYLDGKGKYKAVPGKPSDYDEARRLIFEHAMPLESLKEVASAAH